MTKKTIEQFKCDYFKDTDTISVNCNWLQEQLRLLDSLNRANHRLMDLLEVKSALLDIKEPKYSLDIRG